MFSETEMNDVQVILSFCWCAKNENPQSPTSIIMKVEGKEPYRFKAYGGLSTNDSGLVVVSLQAEMLNNSSLFSLLKDMIALRNDETSSSSNVKYTIQIDSENQSGVRLYTSASYSLEHNKHTFRVEGAFTGPNVCYSMASAAHVARHAIFYDYKKNMPLTDEEKYLEMIELENFMLESVQHFGMLNNTKHISMHKIQHDYLKRKFLKEARNVQISPDGIRKINQLFVRTLYASGHHELLRQHAQYTNDGMWHLVWPRREWLAGGAANRHMFVYNIDSENVEFVQYDRKTDGSVSNFKFAKMRVDLFLRFNEDIPFSKCVFTDTKDDNLRKMVTNGQEHKAVEEATLEYKILGGFPTATKPALKVHVSSWEYGKGDEIGIFIHMDGVRALKDGGKSTLTFRKSCYADKKETDSRWRTVNLSDILQHEYESSETGMLDIIQLNKIAPRQFLSYNYQVEINVDYEFSDNESARGLFNVLEEHIRVVQTNNYNKPANRKTAFEKDHGFEPFSGLTATISNGTEEKLLKDDHIIRAQQASEPAGDEARSQQSKSHNNGGSIRRHTQRAHSSKASTKRTQRRQQ